MGAMSEGEKCEKLDEIVIDGDLEKFFKVGAQLPPQEKEKLIAFLERTLMCLHGMLIKVLGWIQASFSIT